MSKTLKKKKHWLSKVQECAVSWAGPPGDLGAEIRGGAERGEFPYLGRLRDEPGGGGGTCCVVSGKAPSPGDVLLEVNGTPVSGLTNRDTLAVIRHFREPIRLKTVKPGFTLAALFVIARTWKQPRCSSTEKWIKKMWYVYTMEYYSVVKNNDTLKFACKWMELGKNILSEVTQTQKDEHDMYSLIRGY